LFLFIIIVVDVYDFLFSIHFATVCLLCCVVFVVVVGGGPENFSVLKELEWKTTKRERK
jgi:hypothetical protein